MTKELARRVEQHFALFLLSNEYAFLMAHVRASQGVEYRDYVTLLTLLDTTVQQARVVSWREAQTRGKLFVAYSSRRASLLPTALHAAERHRPDVEAEADKEREVLQAKEKKREARRQRKVLREMTTPANLSMLVVSTDIGTEHIICRVHCIALFFFPVVVFIVE